MIIRVSTWKFAAQRGMLLGVLQRGSQQVAGILLLLLASLASWPACLAGISMSESPPKARTRFIYSILRFFCTGCSQKLFLTNRAAFCCTNCCLPSQSLSPSLCSLCCGKCGAHSWACSLVQAEKNHQQRRAHSAKFFGVFLTGQLHKYALQLTVSAKWQLGGMGQKETSKLLQKIKLYVNR